MLSPVAQVDLCGTAQHQLQLVSIEDGQHAEVDHFVEAPAPDETSRCYIGLLLQFNNILLSTSSAAKQKHDSQETHDRSGSLRKQGLIHGFTTFFLLFTPWQLSSTEFTPATRH